jgi:hypothetical protein
VRFRARWITGCRFEDCVAVLPPSGTTGLRVNHAFEQSSLLRVRSSYLSLVAVE